MQDFVSDFTSVEGNSKYSVECNSDSISYSDDDNSDKIPIPLGLGYINSIQITELGRKNPIP